MREWVFGGAKIPGPLMRGEALNDFKSVECLIMDWSDDAAYSLNDIVDGVRAGFLTVERIESWADGGTIGAAEQRFLDTLFDPLLNETGLRIFFRRKSDHSSRPAGSKCATISWRKKAIATNTRLIVDENALNEAAFFKKMANDIIFESPQLEQLEHKGSRDPDGDL